MNKNSIRAETPQSLPLCQGSFKLGVVKCLLASYEWFPITVRELLKSVPSNCNRWRVDLIIFTQFRVPNRDLPISIVFFHFRRPFQSRDHVLESFVLKGQVISEWKFVSKIKRYQLSWFSHFLAFLKTFSIFFSCFFGRI